MPQTIRQKWRTHLLFGAPRLPPYSVKKDANPRIIRPPRDQSRQPRTSAASTRREHAYTSLEMGQESAETLRLLYADLAEILAEFQELKAEAGLLNGQTPQLRK